MPTKRKFMSMNDTIQAQSIQRGMTVRFSSGPEYVLNAHKNMSNANEMSIQTRDFAGTLHEWVWDNELLVEVRYSLRDRPRVPSHFSFNPMKGY
jgi:hypothetical protein